MGAFNGLLDGLLCWLFNGLLRRLLNGMLHRVSSLIPSKVKGAVLRPFFARHCAITVLGSVIAAHGFGSWWLYLLLWGGILSLLITEPDSSPGKRCAFAAFAAVTLAEPSLSLCTSLLATALILAKYRRQAAGLLAANISFLVSPWLPVPAFLLHPVASLMVYCLIVGGGRFLSWGGYWGALVPFLYAFGLIMRLGVTFELNPVPSMDVAPGYQVGASIEKLTGCEFPVTGTLCYEHHQADTKQLRGALYLDHGAVSPFAGGDFKQSRPWGNHVPVGAEPLVMAVKRDGAWICNIGSSLDVNTCRFIGGLVQEGRLYSLLGSHDGQFISGDADFALDCLAPYQKHLICHLAGSDTPYRVFSLLCAISLVGSSVYARGLWLLVPAIAYLVPGYISTNGDVRYVGKHHAWAHTELGEGIVRYLQQSGNPAVFGTTGAQVLVVGQGRKTTWNGERVVILEPSAQVNVNGTIYKAGAIPLGPRNGISDARAIYASDSNLSSGILQGHHPLIIATGSPCSLSIELLCSE